MAAPNRKYMPAPAAGDQRATYTPEQALLASVLERVCDDLARARAARTPRAQAEVRAIFDWFNSTATAWGAFLFICDHLDLCPEAARANVRAGGRP